MYNRKNIAGYLAVACLSVLLTAIQFSCRHGNEPGQEQPAVATGNAPGVSSSFVMQPQHANPFVRIGPDTVAYCGSLIDTVPPIRDEIGRIVRGYMFKPDDYTNLSKLNFSQLYFELGVRNFQDSVKIKAHDPNTKIIYTLMVIPLDAQGKQITDPVSGQLVAYDYVCPCSKGVGCCPVQ